MVAEGVARILLVLIYLGVVSIAFWLLVRWRTDSFRNQLFILRDELFDVALKGDVAFKDRAYILLRDRINRMLRFAHQVKLSHVILLSIFSNKMMSETSAEIEREWNDALNGLESVESHEILQDIQARFHLKVGLYAVTGAMTLALLWGLFRLGNQMREQAASYFRKKALVVEADCRFSSDSLPVSL